MNVEYQSIVDMGAVFSKIKANAKAFQGKIPFSSMSVNGKYRLNNGGGWTDGFYIGVLNLAYALTEDEEFLTLAEQYRDFLKIRIQNDADINRKNGFLDLDHDVGMIFLPATGFWYEMDPNDEDKEILLKAADVLASRFNEKGNFIRAWNIWPNDTEDFIEEKKGKLITDSLLNVPLLFKATEITGNEEYYNIALKHIETVAEYIVRDDYSTYHTYNFNPVTGEPIAGKTAQGLSDESCWSRGQSWAVYGFALAYKYTKQAKFLTLSEKTAAYFMSHLNAVDLPPWDFTAGTGFEFVPWDSSAATVCASGLLELYELTGNESYKNDALRLIKALERFCVTDAYEDCQPLLLHNTAGTAYHAASPKEIKICAIDQASVYADYYYMECKLKLSNKKIRVF